jgi:protein SCO1/2
MLVVLGLIVAGCSDPTLAGMVREPPPAVSEISLPDMAAGGEKFTTTAAPGGLLLVYFGYTNCPDICPTTMADLRKALTDLGDGVERIEVAMITVDPERDIPDRLVAYIQSFFDDGHALRTEDPAELRTAAEAFGVSYEVTTGESGVTEVAHSAFLFAVDATGHIVVQWPFGTTWQDIRDDLDKLLKKEA